MHIMLNLIVKIIEKYTKSQLTSNRPIEEELALKSHELSDDYLFNYAYCMRILDIIVFICTFYMFFSENKFLSAYTLLLHCILRLCTC